MTRECSYDPSKHLVQYKDEATNQPVVDPLTGEAKYYLPTSERVAWFRVYCKEHGVDGLVDAADVRFEYLNGSRELTGWCIAVATVHIDGKLVARAAASVPIYGSGTYDKYIVATATTYAKGRALADAGFNTLEAGIEPGEGVPSIPPETPVSASQLATHGIQVPAPSATAENAAQTIPATQSNVPMPAEEPEEPKEEPKVKIEHEMTVEEAGELIWPTNAFKGQKLKDLMNTDNGRRGISRVANGELSSRYREMYPEFIRACTILIKAGDIQVS